MPQSRKQRPGKEKEDDPVSWSRLDVFSFMARMCLLFSVTAMALILEWPRKLGIIGEGGLRPNLEPIFVAPIIGQLALLFVQRVLLPLLS